MNFAQCIYFSIGSSNGINAGIKTRPNFKSNGFDNIMEKALLQREDQSMLKDPEENQAQYGFRALNEGITEQQVCSKENIKSEASEKSKPAENLTKEETNPILVMLSGLLNLSPEKSEGIRDILDKSWSNESDNEQSVAAAIDEIRILLEGDKLLSKEDINNAIDLLESLKQSSVEVESLADESKLTVDNLKMVELSEDNKNENQPNRLDHQTNDPKEEATHKMESAKPVVSENIFDNKDSNDEEENIEQMDLEHHKESTIKFDSMIKKSDFTEAHIMKGGKVDISPDTEFTSSGEINLANSDNSKYVQKNVGIMSEMRTSSKEDLFKQIIENSMAFNNQDSSEIRIHLKPDSLGKLTISLIMEEGKMTARFVAENQAVKETIESNFSELRDALNQKGLNIQNLSVSVGQQGKWKYENQNFRAWKNNIKRVYNIGNDDLDGETSILSYDNPYNLNNGLVDIKV